MNEKELITWLINYLDSIKIHCDDKTQESIKNLCKKLDEEPYK